MVLALTITLSSFGCSKDDDPIINVPVNATLTYSTNGATSGSAPSAVTQEAGTSITLDNGTGFSRSGFTFAGWNTNTNGSGTNYSGGSSFTIENNITLYARWNVVPSTNTLKISVEANNDGNIIIFELNNSSAAQSLYNQLPLTLPVQNYSSNEKIFYPPQSLDLTNTPVVGGTAGGLAYYAPWGNVIMYYGNYGPMPTLGQAVQGSQYINGLSGTIQIKKVE
ncbi:MULTISPECIES: cyclophilin-like fold protein [Chryseobacterium]|uniref:cyclophilin-like fold protein n=1 Tax=Chryseobacterium TaxID=59732 RepID=UPI00195A7257|nr:MULTISPECIES: cyclophilin-like fold protein [Chryseobacterium]MBM7421319.1 putative repeat protein (TIGR02543 family) [Chryseobacterium sp. JUb44]WSO09939.1 cyclophilin-like fold protein [Chryseobacterium scophthalmum]